MHPILFNIWSFEVATYGVLVASGYMAGIFYLRRWLKVLKMPEERFDQFVLGTLLSAVLGGKVLYVVLYWNQFGGWLDILRSFRFGFVFYGGFIGVVVFGLWFCRRKKMQFLALADAAAPAAALGHAIGRLGCLMAGCCYGRPTRVFFGVAFTDSKALVDYPLMGVPLHPTQLYEAFGNLAVFAVLHRLMKRKYAVPASADGGVISAYTLLYAALRFAIEFFRADDRGGFFWGLSPSQWAAAALAAGALILRAKYAFSENS